MPCSHLEGEGSNAMRVLALTTSLKSMGGVQRYSLILIRALQELLGEQQVRWLEVKERSEGVNVPKKLSLATKASFAFQTFHKALLWKPNLIIACHIGLAPLAWLIGKLLRCPYWIAAHGIEVWGALPFLKQNALRKAEKVLAVSAFTRERLILRHQVLPEHIVVLPNTLDNHLLTIPPDGGRLARLDVNGHPVVLTVGRLAASERYKGHDVVLQALPLVLAKVPNVTYLIVGNGDDRPRLEALAWELGVREHVYFLGAVSEAELVACYQVCDVFVMPAQTILNDYAPKGEGFGIVFLEAMAFGKPVIGPNYGAPAEFIRHGEHGLLVNPTNPEEVADALITLLTNPEQARQMGEAGRAWVMREFSYEKFKKRLAELIRNR